MNKKELPPFRAILFDMGGTLLRHETWVPEAGNAKLLEYAINAHGYTAADIEKAIREIGADLYKRREDSWLELPPWTIERLVYERLGIEFTIDAYEREAIFLKESRRWAPEPDIAESLERLSECGISMAVVSNSAFSSKALVRELEEHDLAKYFVFVISSADYVVRKPHPLIFLTAAAKLGTPASQIVYVGDTPDYDVVGAKSADMITVLYNPNGGEHTTAVPDIIVENWVEFADKAITSFMS